MNTLYYGDNLEVLRASPGALGWGSFYELLRQHGLTNEVPDAG